jgi:hypothetical protein
MNFRFPISPNFSITGQPISRPISGDLPAEYHQRIELLDAVFDKFEAVHEAHEQARAIVLASQQGGPSFALYLRNFEVEEFRYSDDSRAGSGSTWCPQPRHQSMSRRLAFAALPSVIGGSGSDFIARGRGALGQAG